MVSHEVLWLRKIICHSLLLAVFYQVDKTGGKKIPPSSNSRILVRQTQKSRSPPLRTQICQKFSLKKPGVGQNNGHVCFAHCQEFRPFKLLTSRLIQLHFSNFSPHFLLTQFPANAVDPPSTPPKKKTTTTTTNKQTKNKQTNKQKNNNNKKQQQQQQRSHC